MTVDRERIGEAAAAWSTGPIRLKNPWIEPEVVLALLDELDRLEELVADVRDVVEGSVHDGAGAIQVRLRDALAVYEDAT